MIPGAVQPRFAVSLGLGAARLDGYANPRLNSGLASSAFARFLRWRVAPCLPVGAFR